MNVAHFISRRYLFSKKHVSLISIITGISIAGITVGTALLIVVLSVMNGFFETIKGFLLSFDPDVRVEYVQQSKTVMNTGIIELIQGHPGVENVAPYVFGKVMLITGDERSEVVTVKGIDPNGYIRMQEMEQSLREGVFDLMVRDGSPGVVISESLASRFRLQPNSKIALMSSSGMKRALTQFSSPRISRFEVRGSYSMQQIIEGDVIYVDLAAAQRLFNMPSQVTGFDLKLHSNDMAAQVKRDLEKELGEGFMISTWYDLQKPLYDVINLEKWASFFVLMIIVFVAVLNIVGSLTMIVLQKRKDIGLLMSLGMTPNRVKRIFRYQGFIVGLIGCGFGGALGLFLSWVQKEFGIVKLSSAFIIEAYPVSVNPFDIVVIVGGSLLLCLAASWYPSARAASVQPADSIRNE